MPFAHMCRMMEELAKDRNLRAEFQKDPAATCKAHGLTDDETNALLSGNASTIDDFVIGKLAAAAGEGLGCLVRGTKLQNLLNALYAVQ